ncbi:MAG TPA: proteasome accessory factor PafA2 family protein [Fimbriimonadaceae bacterium]|nr:proteasome accessory factor PafA2 family protein [Fimbriimonadaceae bacterium]
MRPVLAGLDTEYGFSVAGRGPQDQIDDAKALIGSYPGECLSFWDQRFESPRNDLRGFKVESLSVDPQDAHFDHGRSHGTIDEVRSDRVLTNGARLYNDHGHPEFATPETWSVHETVLHDRAGDRAILAAALAYEEETGREVRVYKNNTDFHGASYGTHESYLVPRSVAVESLVKGLMPLLIARQVLTGAGKVGAEGSRWCDFQISQRADFFTVPLSVDTLYRRPVFNTRDEPHADPAKWMRLHVICGESNMVSTATLLKLALVKIALHLVERGDAPQWNVADPVRSFMQVSRDVDGEGRITLEGASWTTARQVIESYLDSFERLQADSEDCLHTELADAAKTARRLLAARFERPDEFKRSVDWAAKRDVLLQYAESEGKKLRDPSMQSIDLEYHRIDKGEGLFHALVQMGAVDAEPAEDMVDKRTRQICEDTRARARSIAVTKFRDSLATASWGSLTFGDKTVLLRPDATYPATLDDCTTVEEFIMQLERCQ